MEQQQFKISFSLGSKLLVSVVALLLVVIGFLTVITILVLNEDKRAYTLQSQETENKLVGLEFIAKVDASAKVLKNALSLYDPARELSATENRSIQSVLDNQNDIVLTELGTLSRSTHQFKVQRSLPVDKLLLQSEFVKEELAVTEEWWAVAADSLLKSAFYFANLSKAGHHPLIAVIIADLGYAGDQAPVAVGYLPLVDFAKDVRGSRVSVLNQDGFVLHDTDPAVLFSVGNLAKDPIFSKAIKSPAEVKAGAGEFHEAGVRFLGSFFKTDYQLVVTSRTDWRQAMRATYTLTEKFVLLGVMCIAGAIIYALFFARTLTAPLLALYGATRAVSSGNFDLQLNTRSRDEIGALGASFNVMSQKIQDLIQESMKKVKLENELAIASTVQRTLFPPKFFDSDRIKIISEYHSASQCGGDWWGFFNVGDRTCIMIADATGHGMPSALITASARSCFSVMHKLAEEDPDFTFSPGAMLAFVNRVVSEAASGQIMMTFFSCVIDFTEKKLTYANAGHNPPWLFRKGDNQKFALSSLTPNGPRVGENPDVAPYAETTLDIGSGDLLFLYTDGIPEGTNVSGKQFGKKQMKKTVEAHLELGPEGVVRNLILDFLNYSTAKELDDDVTIAVAQIK